jgi:hypothetical protein
MYLHANLDDISLFAGRVGETAAHSAYTRLSLWSQTKEARIAVYHAAQILRAVSLIPAYQIRGPDDYMLYHAIMILWTYSMMIKDRARKTGTTTPTRTIQTTEGTVFLDDALSKNETNIDASIRTNSRKPFLRAISTPPTSGTSHSQERPEICDLRYPSQVMKAGVKILNSTHPDTDHEHKPPLIRALCRLMEELGGL